MVSIFVVKTLRGFADELARTRAGREPTGSPKSAVIRRSFLCRTLRDSLLVETSNLGVTKFRPVYRWPVSPVTIAIFHRGNSSLTRLTLNEATFITKRKSSVYVFVPRLFASREFEVGIEIARERIKIREILLDCTLAH